MAPPTSNPLPHRPAEWLLLAYQLPAKPSKIRVRTWRRLQQVGAVGLKNSAYVLPNTPQSQEDFEWIKAEVAASRGEASIFLADPADAATAQEIAKAFRNARQADFFSIIQRAKTLLSKIKKSRIATPLRQKLARRTRLLRERLDDILAVDFLQASGREEAVRLVEQTERLMTRSPGAARAISKPGGKGMTEKFHARTWVTRPRPGVDRMSSGWLIRRFIDPEAKFAFANKVDDLPDAVAFDMFGAQLSHEGNSCTFETLLRRFGIANQALGRIGEIVHNLDLKDERYEVPEAAAVGRLVEGLREIHADDQRLLEHGMEIFEALYRSLTNTPPGKSRRRSARSYTGLS
jgi:hypothetical protein